MCLLRSKDQIYTINTVYRDVLIQQDLEGREHLIYAYISSLIVSILQQNKINIKSK